MIRRMRPMKELQRFNVSWSSEIHFSIPATGRPLVFWRHGSRPDIIIEQWPEVENQPYKPGKGYSLDDIKKYVIYDRRKPYIQGIFILGDRTAENTQKIIVERLESQGRMDKREALEAVLVQPE